MTQKEYEAWQGKDVWEEGKKKKENQTIERPKTRTNPDVHQQENGQTGIIIKWNITQKHLWKTSKQLY